MASINYPTEDKIAEFNLLVINLIKVRKADKSEVLSYSKLINIIDRCKEKDGDIYDKAVTLLKGVVQEHPFASGNRRTAFVTTKYFLSINKKKLGIKDQEKQARVMQGIREDYYEDQEIKEWIKNGKIREFKR